MSRECTRVDVGASAQVDFETRRDVVTGVTAGTSVPVDEYAACCGGRSSSWAPIPAAW